MIRAILVTGLIAGVLDGLAAVGNYLIRGGRTPMRVFNFIASGVFGPAALTGGTPMAFAGIVFHLLIAIGWTFLYFMAARRYDVLRRHFIGAGLVYGVIVWLMMNKLVLPLSRVQTGAGGSWTQRMIGVSIIVVFVGLPIAIGARRHFSQPAVR